MATALVQSQFSVCQVHIGNFHFLAQLVAKSEYAAWEAWIEKHCFDEAIGNWQP